MTIANLKALADVNNMKLYEYVSNNNSLGMPVPMMNIINGGKHADNKLDIQE